MRVRVSHIGISKITKKLFWIIWLYYSPSDANGVKFSFGHGVGKPDLCCGLEDNPKRVVDQQDIWHLRSQSERSVGLSTRQLRFLSRIHTFFDRILWFFRGWYLTFNFVLIQFFVTSYFRHCVNKIVTLLECYAAYIVTYLMTFRDNFLVPSSRVKQPNMEYLTLEAGTYWMSRNVGNWTTNLRCLSSQNSEYFTIFFIIPSIHFLYVICGAIESEDCDRAVQYQDACLCVD